MQLQAFSPLPYQLHRKNRTDCPTSLRTTSAATSSSQVLYPAPAKGAHERKVIRPKGVPGVKSGSEEPIFHPGKCDCLHGVCSPCGLIRKGTWRISDHSSFTPLLPIVIGTTDSKGACEWISIRGKPFWENPGKAPGRRWRPTVLQSFSYSFS